MFPRFFVIGVQKGATSWIYYCLDEHPEIFVPDSKREDFYLGGDEFRSRGLGWWKSRFKDAKPEQIVGDVSVEYLNDLSSVDNISKYIDKPNFIISIRNPVSRALSAYLWHVRKGNIPNLPPSKGLSKAIVNFKSESQTSAYPQAYIDIIDRGFYYEKIKKYLEAFGGDSIYVIPFWHIKQKPVNAIRGVYKFLGVSPIKPDSAKTKAKKTFYSRFLISIERHAGSSTILNKGVNVLHRGLSSLFGSKYQKKVSNRIKNELRQLYLPENKRLRDLIKECNMPVDCDVGSGIESWKEEF